MKREIIDKRTRAGKDIVKKVQRMHDERSLSCSREYGIHPGLTGLRIKDLEFFTLKFNLN